MGYVPTQRLATRQQFFQYGISETRIKEEIVAEPESDEASIEMWIAAASGTVLRKLASFMTLPLVEWGNDLVQMVCILAADIGKKPAGLPAGSEEWKTITESAATIRTELNQMRTRKDAPQGIVDSTPEEGPYTRSPTIIGYSLDVWVR